MAAHAVDDIDYAMEESPVYGPLTIVDEPDEDNKKGTDFLLSLGISTRRTFVDIELSATDHASFDGPSYTPLRRRLYLEEISRMMRVYNVLPPNMSNFPAWSE